ncbi:hypothetical protein EV182_006318, partial [Spiromyces aspiralis]
MTSLHEQESTKIALLLKAVPTHIREKVVMNYNEEIKTLNEAIQCICKQMKSCKYYDLLTDNINNIHINLTPISATMHPTLPMNPKEEDTNVDMLANQLAKM